MACNFSNSSLKDIEIRNCNSLQSSNFPTKLTNLIISHCNQCFPLNSNELLTIPFGQQLYYSNKEYMNHFIFELP